MNRYLTDEQVEKLDPYQFMAELGKQVIHPGGKYSTKQMYRMANLQKGMHVLDIGCGVGTTAIEIAKKFGCYVTASDIDQNMLDKAVENVKRAGLSDKIEIVKADIQQMPFETNKFDAVIVEAVTMFVNRKKAIQEIHRVCKNNCRVIEHEFIWRKKPTHEVRKIFEGEVCPNIKFDTAEDWINIFREHGFKNENAVTGNFRMMSIKGFLNDEGIKGTLALMLRTFSRKAYLKKMMWLMPRIIKVRSSLRYIVFSTVKTA